MADQPDYTTSVDIIAQTLATLDIDIVAQTLATLNVDIVAQTLAQINVDIIAQTVGNLAVNITAQDLAQLVIKIAAQTVGVYLQPEWTALQGTDKNMAATAAGASGALTLVLTYTVPTGKTLYINQWGFNVQAAAGVIGLLYSTATPLVYSGGYSGNAHSLPKPVAVAAGGIARIYCIQYSSGAATMGASLGGYEL